MVKYSSEIKIEALVKVNGKIIGVNSPTTALKNDIVREIGSCTKFITGIDKICLVDDQDTERDCTTSLTFTDNAPTNVIVQGSIQASAPYTVKYIEVYSGEFVYFLISHTVTLNQGDVLDISIEISASVTCSLSGSVTQSSCDPSNLIMYLLKRLIGQETPCICLKRAKLMYYSETEGRYVSGLTIELTLDYDITYNKATGSGSGTSVIDFSASYLEYDNGEETPVMMIVQMFDQTLPIYVDTVVTVSFEFSVT